REREFLAGDRSIADPEELRVDLLAARQVNHVLHHLQWSPELQSRRRHRYVLQRAGIRLEDGSRSQSAISQAVLDQDGFTASGPEAPAAGGDQRRKLRAAVAIRRRIAKTPGRFPGDEYLNLVGNRIPSRIARWLVIDACMRCASRNRRR